MKKKGIAILLGAAALAGVLGWAVDGRPRADDGLTLGAFRGESTTASSARAVDATPPPAAAATVTATATATGVSVTETTPAPLPRLEEKRLADGSRVFTTENGDVVTVTAGGEVLLLPREL